MQSESLKNGKTVKFVNNNEKMIELEKIIEPSGKRTVIIVLISKKTVKIVKIITTHLRLPDDKE